MTAELVQLRPPFSDSSYRSGGVMIILPERFAPDTVKVCVADAVPIVCTNDTRFCDTIIDGNSLTVPLTAIFCDAAPVLACIILPE